MPQGYDLLAVTRVSRIMQTLAEELEPAGSLRFLGRVPVVPADEAEVMGTFESRVVSADIVADDQAATIRQGGRIVLTTAAIPNIKQGSLVTQSIINQLKRINRGAGVPGDRGLFSNYLRRELDSKLAAIRVMQNRMIAGMMLDNFTYKKNGIVYTNVSWGMPASLKFVPSVPWIEANLATMKPIDDIMLYVQTATDDHGEAYNRITMPRSLFRVISRSENFRQHAATFTVSAQNAATFPQVTNRQREEIFATITGLTVEFEDATFKDENNDGTTATNRYQPANQAYLSNSNDDNSDDVFDFAHTTVNETEVGVVPGTQVLGGGFTAPQMGPVAYATIRGDLNPPNLTLWAVERGFPRKHRATATARITAFP